MNPYLKSSGIAGIVLGLSLGLTGFGWYLADRGIRRIERLRFERWVFETEDSIRERMGDYLIHLQSGERLFATMNHVSRRDWRVFTDPEQFQSEFPGILGMGFVEGQAERFPIVYQEPFDQQNQRNLGYDVTSNPVRDAAMAQARDTGKAALSGKVQLADEAGHPQVGFLAYYPVYAKDLPHHTVSQRRRALRGFVYAAFRTSDLFRDIFEYPSDILLHFQVYDGAQPIQKALLYDNLEDLSPDRRPAPGYHSRMSDTEVLNLAQHQWCLVFMRLPGSEKQDPSPRVVAIAGTIISFLLAGLAFSLSTSRERAIAIAMGMTQDLRQADQAKDDFLAVISHELRTPLNAITGFSSLLEDEVAGPLNEQQMLFIRKIMSGADAMLLLVNNLLDLSRLTLGKLKLIRETTSLSQIVTHVMAFLKPLADKKQLTLQADLTFDDKLSIDPDRIGQVLNNLLGNAIKFTPPGGDIRIHVFRRGNDAVIEVSDTGIGIAPEDLPKLFKKFQQVDMSTTRRIGGSGLGLAISKALVEAHQGTIGVRSVPGEGSTFWFSLPLESKPRA